MIVGTSSAMPMAIIATLISGWFRVLMSRK